MASREPKSPAPPSSPSPHHSTLAELERAILRELCASDTSPHARSAAIRSLAKYPWAAQDHRVVFDAISRCALLPPSRLRDELPALATRQGFPDIPWSEFFAAPPASTAARTELPALVERLLKSESAPGR